MGNTHGSGHMGMGFKDIGPTIAISLTYWVRIYAEFFGWGGGGLEMAPSFKVGYSICISLSAMLHT